MPNTLKKAERLDRKKVIGKMFTGGAGAHSFTVFPLRVVYLMEPELMSQASVLISVSKRYFKHAVDRNRVKRQIREAYRLNKHILLDFLSNRNEKMAVSFIYLSEELMPTDFIEKRMKIALEKMLEKLAMKHLNTESHEESVV
jgi:ribonuclease P protein component